VTVEEFYPDSDVTQLYDNAQRVLQTFSDVFAEYGVALPSRQFTTWDATENVPVDCEQLTVQVIQAYNGTPGQQAQVPTKCQSGWTATYACQLWRCLPTVFDGTHVPDASQLDAVGKTFMVDAALMRKVACEIDSWGFRGGIMWDLTPLAQNGGYGGTQVNIVALVV